MEKPKFNVYDKVMQKRGSFIYIILSYHYDKTISEYVYETESITCGYTKFFKESELNCVGW